MKDMVRMLIVHLKARDREMHKLRKKLKRTEDLALEWSDGQLFRCSGCARICLNEERHTCHIPLAALECGDWCEECCKTKLTRCQYHDHLYCAQHAAQDGGCPDCSLYQ